MRYFLLVFPILIGLKLHAQTNTFPTTGNVGIGITNPLTKLHINNGNNSYGAILAQANESSFHLYTKSLITQPTNVETFRFGLKYNTDENNGYISFYRGGGTSGGFLGFSTNGIERVRINSNGNFGIGTINPTEKLVVDGKILAEEVKVQNVPSSDYVFEPDYNLLSLQEVETFIKENKHLPNIPSAEEFKENGVGLGEMDNMLLRKVEELMLYVIELKKSDNRKHDQIEELKRENEELKNSALRMDHLENLVNQIIQQTE